MGFKKLAASPPDDRTKMAFLAVDPGPGCGFAAYHPYPSIAGANFDTWTVQLGNEGHELLEKLLTDQYYAFKDFLKDQGPSKPVLDIEDAVLITEMFEYRKIDSAFRAGIDYTAAEYVGICKLAGMKTWDGLIMQNASEAKAFWDDSKLRRIGLYKPNSKHEMDALRHLLRYMAFRLNQKWLLQLLRPT